MTQPAIPQPQTQPGQAVAEEGLVILDGPAGIAVTMTPDAAASTGQSLLDAAAVARSQNKQPNQSEA
ncbi:hypothetical protein KRR38_22265 [Novosphingobium sp. G106]|uniref:hypothetical protein n=1 Tax=Novosphingobium sp. G106 TaxID=2849500 RepID=UPI001C2CD44D|nr:hypothetical protein [Novosphingobium sp. G106]MBV1690333.1 hypothetical protein [Novosphingobium sp. G106]